MKSQMAKRTIFDSLYFGYVFLVLLAALLRPDEESLLNLSQNTLLFAGLTALGALFSVGLNKISVPTLGEVIFKTVLTSTPSESKTMLKTFWGWQLLVGFVLTLIVGFKMTQFSIYDLTDADGVAGAYRLFAGLASPNFEVLPRAVLNILETIYIAFIATTLAIPIAFVLSFFCAKNVMTHPVAFVIYSALRTFLNITRSVEALIWAIIFSVWVGIGPFAGMLALMIHSIASLAKQYSEMVESVSEGPVEGIRSTGAGFLQVIWFAIVPQVLLPYIAFTIYRWDINVRMATIIGLVGGGGIGTMLIKYQGQAMWPEVGCIIIVIAAVVWLMDTASAYIREAIK